MKASWQTELRQIELPETPPPGEVLLRVEACGICGTDLSAAVKAEKWQPFGHEIAGVIEKVGEGLGHLSPGQKVVLETSSFCGHCAMCRNGRVNLCNKAPQFWGRPAMGFSEHMVAPGCCVVPYEGLSAEVASLAEPAGVAYDMVKTANVAFGDRVALIGPGPIGLMAIPILLRGGAREVVCLGRSRNKLRLEVAQKLGAKIRIVEGSPAGEKDLQRQFEHVLVTAPVGTIPSALGLLAYGGELTYIGIGTEAGPISFDANEFHFRKLQLRASFASPALYFPIVLDLLRANVIPGDLIISHRFSLKDLAEAMHLNRDRKEEAVKVVMRNP
ncbi:MAG: alcohol dehydrogenase catalytic domain-containing protein [Methylacidiphilales bacterium]|nr:alcohol dehydrogenase catalytic domain-containing protein [Candidatus Methylacidiphilales bacterium]